MAKSNVIYNDSRIVISETNNPETDAGKWLAYVTRATKSKPGLGCCDEAYNIATSPTAEAEIDVTDERLKELLTGRELVGRKAVRRAKELGV
jgi:hypothetical protein